MFKDLLKSRHGAQSKNSGAPPPTKGPAPTPSYSVNPVEYNMSPLPQTQQAPLYVSSPAPVSYNASPIGPMQYGAHAAIASVAPVEYNMNEPKPQPLSPKPQPQISTVGAHRPIQPQQLSPNPNDKYTYYAPQQQAPAELPASAVPQRYEMPAVNSATRTPGPPYSPPAPKSPNSGWSSPTSTLVPSPRSPALSPNLGSSKAEVNSTPCGNENVGIKKFVVDIYCPLKRDANGNRREQIPRDVREFRLSKIALIPIVAGKRSFVSLDVVFGEADKIFGELVEKHFSFSQKTHVKKVNPGTVAGGEVFIVGPLAIAYRDGDQASVYIKFRSVDDTNKFLVDFASLSRYVEK